VADLAAEAAPVDGPARESTLLCHLRLQPVLEARVVNVAHTATAFADGQEWVLNLVATVPAKAAEHFLIIFN